MHVKQMLLLGLLLGACGAPAENAVQDEASTGGEDSHHGHHGHHDGAMRCHGRGPEGDFSDAECFARMFDAPERDAWQHPDEVVGLLNLAEGMTVADLGAGTGYFESRLSTAVGPTGAVLALDVQPEMITYMQERFTREGLANVTARQVPFTSAELPAASVDRILVVDTWHHIEGRVAYAQALRTALREGGTLTIVDFTMESPEGPPAEMRLTADAVLAELAEAGLRGEILEEPLPNQWVVRASTH